MDRSLGCPICSAALEVAFSATVLRRHAVRYLSCGSCGLLKAESPFWLEEAYQSAIVESDTGVAQRSLRYRRLLEPVLYTFFGEKGTYLDLAGGYGLLTRLMRDIGFDCYTTDRFCQNLLARGFEPREAFRADALFAFEVLEHVENPVSFLADAFSLYGCRTLIFTTLTFSGAAPPRDWWYYGFEHGQHVTFYQPRTLMKLATLLEARYFPISADTHLFTDRPLSWKWTLLLKHAQTRRLYAAWVRLKRRNLSKTWDDLLLVKNAPNRH